MHGKGNKMVTSAMPPSLENRGVTTGRQGSTIPRTPNHYGSLKSPNNVTRTSSIQCICFRKTSGSNMGRQTCFLPRLSFNLVTTCLKSENRKNQINFFSSTAVIGTMWPYQGLLLRHTAYPLTRRSHNSHLVLKTVSRLWCFKAGCANMQPFWAKCTYPDWSTGHTCICQALRGRQLASHLRKIGNTVLKTVMLTSKSGHKISAPDHFWPMGCTLLFYGIGETNIVSLNWRFEKLQGARELLDVTATSAPSERVFSYAVELYSEKHSNLGARIFAILVLMRMNPHLGMNWSWIKVALIWVNVIRILVQFLVFANPLTNPLNYNLICDSWVSFNFNLI